MIKAVHILIYSDDAPATRAFLRDVLGWPWVESDQSEPGWLIFKSGPSEVGVHPTQGTPEDAEHYRPRQHSVSLMCDDLAATMATLSARGATFAGEPQLLDFGVGVRVHVPGADDILLYEPRHHEAYNLP